MTRQARQGVFYFGFDSAWYSMAWHGMVNGTWNMNYDVILGVCTRIVRVIWITIEPKLDDATKRKGKRENFRTGLIVYEQACVFG